MKNCSPLRSNLHAFILCFQWTASLYAIEKQLSQGFCISLHTSINNNENTNASYTTLDQMLINVYFHLRWLKNKKKTSSSIPSFYIPISSKSNHSPSYFLIIESSTRSWSNISSSILIFPVCIVHLKDTYEQNWNFYMWTHDPHQLHQLELAQIHGADKTFKN